MNKYGNRNKQDLLAEAFIPELMHKIGGLFHKNDALKNHQIAQKHVSKFLNGLGHQHTDKVKHGIYKDPDTNKFRAGTSHHMITHDRLGGLDRKALDKHMEDRGYRKLKEKGNTDRYFHPGTFSKIHVHHKGTHTEIHTMTPLHSGYNPTHQSFRQDARSKYHNRIEPHFKSMPAPPLHTSHPQPELKSAKHEPELKHDNDNEPAAPKPASHSPTPAPAASPAPAKKKVYDTLPEHKAKKTSDKLGNVQMHRVFTPGNSVKEHKAKYEHVKEYLKHNGYKEAHTAKHETPQHLNHQHIFEKDGHHVHLSTITDKTSDKGPHYLSMHFETGEKASKKAKASTKSKTKVKVTAPANKPKAKVKVKAPTKPKAKVAVKTKAKTKAPVKKAKK